MVTANGTDHRPTAGTAGAAAPLFRSILFEKAADADRKEVRAEPEYFPDLNLNQVLTAFTAGREEYDLAPFFYERLDDEEAIRYRQEVFRDLEQPAAFSQITTFAQAMRDMRGSLEQTKKLRHRYQRESWFIDTVQTYGEAVTTLASGLADLDLGSRGIARFRDYLANYVQSTAFRALVGEAQGVKEGFVPVDYAIHIKGSRCTVARYEDEADYGSEVLRTFDRFKQGAARDYRVNFREPPEMNHVEARVLDLVAKLFPEPFAALDRYFDRHQDYLDPTIRRFDREIQFYVSYLEYVRGIASAGLSFCYPEVARRPKEVFATETFDLALATKLVPDRLPVVTNDFSLSGAERIFVVSGPNQGGKTTFARMFGQLHHLASIGYLVPGRAARLHLCDRLFVQFEREEHVENMTGKLEDDLVRVREILSRATPESIVVLNEIFASTTLRDSLFLSTKVMERLIERDLLAVVVTFVEELASLGPSTVSMVSTIVPENPAERTFKVVRKPADGLAYALAIVEKYGVTYEKLKERVLS